MKRTELLAVGIGVLASAGLFGMTRAYAGQDDHPTRCTLATLNGQYLFGGTGMLLPPAVTPGGQPVTSPVTTASAGFHIFNGDGTGNDFVPVSVNGIDQHVPSPIAITYTLNPDCTGTLSVQNGPNQDIFVAVDGSSLTSINTDPGVAGAGGPQPRVRLDR